MTILIFWTVDRQDMIETERIAAWYLVRSHVQRSRLNLVINTRNQHAFKGAILKVKKYIHLNVKYNTMDTPKTVNILIRCYDYHQK